MYYRFDQKTKKPKNKLRYFGIALIVTLCGIGAALIAAPNTEQLSETLQAAEQLPPIEKKEPIKSSKEVYTGKMVFLGDTMLARSIGRGIEVGRDPFIHVADMLASYQLRIANIETTIATSDVARQATKAYTFNAPLAALDILKKHQIDVSILANNHTGDFGSVASSQMIDLFQQKELVSSGLGKTVAQAFSPTIVSMPLASDDGSNATVAVGLIAVNDIELAHTKVSEKRAGGAYFDRKLISNAIADARVKGAQVVVVVPHWGVEYTQKPSSRQVEWGRFFIDAGADLVVGGHPHMTQPTEDYKGKQIVYSLGNFIFDGMSGEANKAQMIEVPITLIRSTNGQITQNSIAMERVVSIPVSIDGNGFPKAD